MKEATIFSTYQLSDDDIKKIIEKIPELKNFKIINKIDKSLIGGFIVEFEDKIIDLSIKNRLKMIFKKIYEQI